MAGLLLDGKSLAKKIEGELALHVQKLHTTQGITPTLATILVGNDPSSVTYVRMKNNACQRIGVESCKVFLPESTTTSELLEHIDKLNERKDVHGILIQHPLPLHINERWCFERIAISKDVDGMTTHSFGRIAMKEPAYGAATPAGIMSLLRHYNLELAGKQAVIVGRSPILGKPMAMMLLNADATVTVCHSKTQNLPEIVRTADIVVGAVGKPHFIRGEWIKDNAIVVDAGYNKGQVGDIELPAIIDRCAAYTPVPGGVGPMTIATLLAHTVQAADATLHNG